MALLPLIVILPLIGFYLWMFHDMVNNDRLGPPPVMVSPPGDFRQNWTFDFLFLNVLAAGIYFVTEYRSGR